MQMQGAFPLDWPPGWPRARFRHQARFDWRLTLAAALEGLEGELRRLGADSAVVSTNVKLRLDGLPYSNQAQPSDVGVAVYFTLKKQRLVLACDRWSKLEHNVRAIELHIGSMRGQERWGVGTFERAFTGYAALPENGTTEKSWRFWLGFEDGSNGITVEGVEDRFRELAKLYHPDVPGGSAERFNQVVNAREQARKELAG